MILALRMSHASRSIFTRLLGPVLVALGLVLTGGCDSVPGRPGERQPPRVANLQVVTDSIQEVPEDSTVRVDVGLAARATDPDGEINRVVFTIEPSSNPRGTVSGTLPRVENDIYAGRIRLNIPLVEELYTVRVFAVDSDSLASNTVTGQFRVEPDQQSRVVPLSARPTKSPAPFSGPASRFRFPERFPVTSVPSHS